MTAAPFLKWAGGKTQLLPVLAPYLNVGNRNYHEPFLGGGAVFFYLYSKGLLNSNVRLSDINQELVTTYRGVRDCLELVIDTLREHRSLHCEEYYYQVRGNPSPLSDMAGSAARMIYLNRNCFNGLYRVNKSGGFNVPFGKYLNPAICDENKLTKASLALRGNYVGDISVHCEDFVSAISRCGANDFIYCDPPYIPVSASSNFTAYAKSGFGPVHQANLELAASQAVSRGAIVVLSNSDTPETRELYRNWNLHSVPARRSINSAGNKRGTVSELIISSLADV